MRKQPARTLLAAAALATLATSPALAEETSSATASREPIVVHRAEVLKGKPSRELPKLLRSWDLESGPDALARLHEVVGVVPKHVHPDSDERIFAIEGAVRVEVGSRTEVLRPGDYLLIPRGTPHKISPAPGHKKALAAGLNTPPADPKKVVWMEPLPGALAIQGAQGDVPLVTLDGKEVKLKDFGRKVTVLAYWGTFCGPCVEELPEVEKLYRKYKADGDVAVLAISVDPTKTAEDRAAIRKYVEKLKLTLPVLADSGPLARKLLQDDPSAPVSGPPRELRLPLLVVIDPAFRVYREFGFNGPRGFVEAKAALIEQARAGKLPAEPPPPNPAAAGAAGPVEMSLKKMTPAQFAASEEGFRAQLRKFFPGATEAELAPLLDKIRAAAMIGGSVELAPPGMSEKTLKAFALGREADRLAQQNPKAALPLYQQAFDQGLRVPAALYNAACAASLSGEKELALTWLARAAEAGLSDAKWAANDSDLALVKNDPRFAAALSRMEANQQKALAAEGAKDPALQKELLALEEEDQQARRALVAGDKSALAKVADIDRKTTARMKEIIARKGWPGRTLVGPRAAHAAWLLVQHSDHDRDFQRRCLSLMEEAVKKNEAEAKELAYLTDRVLVADGKPQRYGTQFHKVNGQLVPQPLEDPDHVDDRRRQVGLGTMAEYKEQMRQTYAPALQREDAGVP